MDEKAVRNVAAGWVLVAAAALAGWGSFVVGSWNDAYGNPYARWAGPGTLLWGALLALLCALVASGASALTQESRWVKRLGVAVVVVAFLGPMASTQAHIAHWSAEDEQEAQFEREMWETYGLSDAHEPPRATGIDAALTELLLLYPPVEAVVLERTPSFIAVRRPTATPENDIATARTRLAAAGWVVDPSADPAVVEAARDGYTVEIHTDRREPLPDEADRGDEGYVEPRGTVITVTGPDDEIDEPNGAGS